MILVVLKSYAQRNVISIVPFILDFTSIDIFGIQTVNMLSDLIIIKYFTFSN